MGANRFSIGLPPPILLLIVALSCTALAQSNWPINKSLIKQMNAVENSFFTANINPTDSSIPVNILLLLPSNQTYKFSLTKVLASLNLAINDIKLTDYGSRFQVAIISDSCDCTGIKAPVNAMENIYRIRNHTKVFQAVFGPMCD